jgi:hypothetical protein
VAEVQDGWVLSGIRLFSHQGAPEYLVVVGRLRSAIEAEEAAERATHGGVADPARAPA